MKTKKTRGIPCGNMKEFDAIMDGTARERVERVINLEGEIKCGCLFYEGGAFSFCPLHAAAPELLSAAKLALSDLVDVQRFIRVPGSSAIMHSVEIRIMELENAIAKAEEK